MAGTTQATRRAIVGINVTPMVDVVLVLLVIMMVSATYIVSQTSRSSCRRPRPPTTSTPSLATVTVTKDRMFLYNDEQVDEPELARKLRSPPTPRTTTSTWWSAPTRTRPTATSSTSSTWRRSTASPSSRINVEKQA